MLILETRNTILVSGVIMDEKNRILNYAREKFFKEGFYKVSMDELAADLRVSKKTIYKHFSSKEKLLREILNEFTSTIVKKVISIFEADDNAALKIVNLLTFIGNIWLNINEKILIDLQIHYPSMWQEIDDLRTKMMNKNLSTIIRQGKKEGIFKDNPEDIITTIFISSVRAIVNPDFLMNHKYSFKEAIGITFNILLKGVLTKEGEKEFRNQITGIE
jgi:AcrR family transcriptional regulator